jgi:hypothetical protein
LAQVGHVNVASNAGSIQALGRDEVGDVSDIQPTSKFSQSDAGLFTSWTSQTGPGGIWLVQASKSRVDQDQDLQ